VSLIPAFEIGVWNAWIFVLVWLLFNAADPNWLVRSRDFRALFKKSSVIPTYNKTEKVINISSLIIIVPFFIYSIFLPLQLGTAWFFVGIAVFLSGLAIWEIAGIPWISTPIEEPVTTGLYRYSRHPLYIGLMLQFVGMGVVSASWIFLLTALVWTVLQIFLLIGAEERFCLEKYGDAYREYLNRTPRWLGIPKLGSKS